MDLRYTEVLTPQAIELIRREVRGYMEECGVTPKQEKEAKKKGELPIQSDFIVLNQGLNASKKKYDEIEERVNYLESLINLTLDDSVSDKLSLVWQKIEAISGRSEVKLDLIDTSNQLRLLNMRGALEAQMNALQSHMTDVNQKLELILKALSK